ncbi:MAG: hypothetical protein C5B55_06480 [Blastocatellia bacterium]|nr:MAG: hypothetical protein C5B55_06480 [Blastocatellia bacterium]
MEDRGRMERIDDRPEQLSARDLAGGAAVKPARDNRDNDAAQRDRDGGDGRESETGSTPLFESKEAESLRENWRVIQTQFVDEPRRSVEEADELVASTMKRLAEVFANERDNLEQNWDRGDDVSTEDLRVALQRYRSFFDRLLSV